MHADASDIYLGARATEREVKHLSETGELGYRILHFATHGALAGQVTGNTLHPPKMNRKIQHDYDQALYKKRHKARCLFR
jgi:hypothetical protein